MIVSIALPWLWYTHLPHNFGGTALGWRTTGVKNRLGLGEVRSRSVSPRVLCSPPSPSIMFSPRDLRVMLRDMSSVVLFLVRSVSPIVISRGGVLSRNPPRLLLPGIALPVSERCSPVASRGLVCAFASAIFDVVISEGSIIWFPLPSRVGMLAETTDHRGCQGESARALVDRVCLILG